MTQTIQDVVKLMDEEKYEEAISAARPFENDTDKEVSETATKIIGLAYFQLGRYAEAEETFKKLCEKSVFSSDWFSLCTSATMNNDIDLGRKAYDKALELRSNEENKSGRHISMLSFFYMQALIDMKKYDEAFEILDDIKKYYVAAGIIDPTYLFNMYGSLLPSFGEVIGRALPIFIHVGKEKSSAWLEDLATNVDKDGKRDVELILKNIQL